MTEPRQTTPPRGPDAPASDAPPWWDEFEAAGADRVPPPRGFPDLGPVFALVDALRRAVPAELQEQFNALVRELLLTVRALIDWYLERLDAAKQPVVVEDIPID